MLLCKIMSNRLFLYFIYLIYRPEDVHQLLNNKLAQPFIDESLRAVEKIAMAFKEGSVKLLCDV